jgi:hypothetical protein
MRISRLLGVMVLALALVMAAFTPAQANSKSASTTYPNGTRLTANVWIQTFASWDGCGDFQTSAQITRRPNWIENTASFTANGWGASIKSFSFGGSGASVSTTWRNSNGQRGSYISGRICANWRTWYVSATSIARAFHYGNLRVVSAEV